MLLALISIIGYLMTILSTVVIIQFILSLLISFNVVSLSNNIVASIWQALSVILDPFLKAYPQDYARHRHDRFFADGVIDRSAHIADAVNRCGQ